MVFPVFKNLLTFDSFKLSVLLDLTANVLEFQNCFAYLEQLVIVSVFSNGFVAFDFVFVVPSNCFVLLDVLVDVSVPFDSFF